MGGSSARTARSCAAPATAPGTSCSACPASSTLSRRAASRRRRPPSRHSRRSAAGRAPAPTWPPASRPWPTTSTSGWPARPGSPPTPAPATPRTCGSTSRRGSARCAWTSCVTPTSRSCTPPCDRSAPTSGAPPPCCGGCSRPAAGPRPGPPAVGVTDPTGARHPPQRAAQRGPPTPAAAQPCRARRAGLRPGSQGRGLDRAPRRAVAAHRQALPGRGLDTGAGRGVPGRGRRRPALRAVAPHRLPRTAARRGGLPRLGRRRPRRRLSAGRRHQERDQPADRQPRRGDGARAAGPPDPPAGRAQGMGTGLDRHRSGLRPRGRHAAGPQRRQRPVRPAGAHHGHAARSGCTTSGTRRRRWPTAPPAT